MQITGSNALNAGTAGSFALLLFSRSSPRLLKASNQVSPRVL